MRLRAFNSRIAPPPYTTYKLHKLEEFMAKFAFLVSNTDATGLSSLRQEMLRLKLNFNQAYELNLDSIDRFENFTDISLSKIKELMKLSLAAPFRLELYNSNKFSSDHYCQLYAFSDDASYNSPRDENVFESIVSPSQFIPFKLIASDISALKLLGALDDVLSKLYQVVSVSDKSKQSYLEKFSKILSPTQLAKLEGQLDYKTRNSNELDSFRKEIKLMEKSIYSSGW